MNWVGDIMIQGRVDYSLVLMACVLVSVIGFGAGLLLGWVRWKVFLEQTAEMEGKNEFLQAKVRNLQEREGINPRRNLIHPDGFEEGEDG